MNKHKIKPEVIQWSPYMIYTWTTKDIQDWYDVHGSFALFNGESWQPQTTKLFVDRYEVRFVKKVFK